MKCAIDRNREIINGWWVRMAMFRGIISSKCSESLRTNAYKYMYEN